MKNPSRLISTPIMKTDIQGFSKKIEFMSGSELSDLLDEHKQFIINKVYKYSGSIIKGEGDSFWIEFDNVTEAVQAGIDIQKSLKEICVESKSLSQLAIRIIITLGDVLHKDDDVFGESINLASRIEAITPPNEIYLSHAAYLTLIQKEINVEFVGDYKFKGIDNKENVYRIELGYKTLIINDTYVLFSDIANFVDISGNLPLFEKVLDGSDLLFQYIEKNYDGNIVNIEGDAYIMRFSDIENLFNALKYLYDGWSSLCEMNNIPNKLRLGCHKGKIQIYRSAIMGVTFNIAAMLENWAKGTKENQDPDMMTIIHLSDKIRNDYVKQDNQRKKYFRKVTKKELPAKFINNLKKSGVLSTYIYCPD